MGKSPGRSYSLGRRDNNAGYSPENCSWETMRQQQNNRRSNRLLMWQGRTQTVMQWARELNLSAHTIYGRLNRGWTVERALITPPR
jgi:predicted transcriptional regulator